MPEKEYIVKESDINGLMTILGDSIPKTMNLDSIFAIHNRFKQNLREYVAPQEKNGVEDGKKH